jgi:hypothetical protein
MADQALAIDARTPLGFRVTCSTTYWSRIETTKHPAMRGRLSDVSRTLEDPDEVRRSVGDAEVLLFHRLVEPRWVCAVVKRTAEGAYLITAYPADKVKQGELAWKK